jgi:small subunit ribosomal protein S4
MAVSREPVLKKCRALDISPGVMGVDRKSERKPGANVKKKVSEYGLQLKEKQKLKFIYGVLERQFARYFELAGKMEGKTGDNLITVLESRLDNVVFRTGFALTRRESRQLATHGHFLVNGKRVDIPSYRVKTGDVIELCEKSRQSEKFKALLEQTKGRLVPAWLDANYENFSASVIRAPLITDLDFECMPHLVVELYSK